MVVLVVGFATVPVGVTSSWRGSIASEKIIILWRIGSVPDPFPFLCVAVFIVCAAEEDTVGDCIKAFASGLNEIVFAAGGDGRQVSVGPIENGAI